MPLGKLEAERVKAYFHYCPLCFAKDSVSVDSPPFRKSNAMCKECGANWELHYSLGKLVGVKLVEVNGDAGKDLLEVEAKPEFWQKKGLDGHIKNSK